MFSEKELQDIAGEEEKWEKECLQGSLERAPERKRQFTTIAGLPTKRFYTPLDIKDMSYGRDLGFPGQYPYTRGAYPTMHRGQQWSIRQLTGFWGPEETNARLKSQIAQGIYTLAPITDTKVLDAYVDPDDPEYDRLYGTDSLGRIGVLLITLRDYEILYDGIPLDKCATGHQFMHFPLREPAMLVALARKRGVPLEKLTGYTQSDTLQLYCGNYYPAFPPEHELKLTVDFFRFCTRHMPRWNLCSMGAYNRQEAGLNAIQELGITIADAITYIREAVKVGLEIDSFVPRIAFHFGNGNHFFEQIAKLRAARRIWAGLLRERFGAENPSSWRMRIHVETAGWTLTAQQPYNNIVRAALQGLGAVLGGTNSLHVTSFDEAMASPSEFAHRLSVRTQQIIFHETGVGDVVDPLAGSYYVEWLTNEIEKGAWELIDKIEGVGGSVAAIKRGFYQEELMRSVERWQREVDSKERVIVGVNEFVSEEMAQPELQLANHEATRRTLDRLRQVKEERDNERVQRSLAKLREACRQNKEIMEAVVECCEAYCTHAEMNRAAREVFGIWQHPLSSIYV